MRLVLSKRGLRIIINSVVQIHVMMCKSLEMMANAIVPIIRD